MAFNLTEYVDPVYISDLKSQIKTIQSKNKSHVTLSISSQPPNVINRTSHKRHRGLREEVGLLEFEATFSLLVAHNFDFSQQFVFGSVSSRSSKKMSENRNEEERLLGLFEGVDVDLLIHDACDYYDQLVLSGVTVTPSLIFECMVWMIRKSIGIENSSLNVDGFLDEALDQVVGRCSELTDREQNSFEDPIAGEFRADLVGYNNYSSACFYTDVATGNAMP